MFIRKKVVSKSTYLYLVESTRIEGKVKQTTLAYLGKNKAQTTASLKGKSDSEFLKTLPTATREKLIASLDDVLKKGKPADCWQTPDTPDQPILSLVAKVFGGQIGLDPCADIAKRVKALHHFTEEDNCLVQSWQGLGETFMNPPFSDSKPFIEKLVQEYKSKAIPSAIGLFKSGVINNKGTGSVIGRSCAGYCLWGGESTSRIAFVNPKTGKVRKGSDIDCVFIYWGERFDKFKEVFAPYGTITRPEN